MKTNKAKIETTKSKKPETPQGYLSGDEFVKQGKEAIAKYYNNFIWLKPKVDA